jgi:S-adenosylmethionine:diacylglycerol 3-amino-3-carboxypropyl transferase
VLARIDAVHDDIVSYLTGASVQHDFIYLSNVPDYLPKKDLETLFRTCREQNSPIYLLLTDACRDKEAVKQIWESVGYVAHPATNELNRKNRGLGSATINKRWNRLGFIWLLLPGDL